MVAILEKGEHNIDFHPMVDFIKASPLRIETTEEGTQILATVDGIHRTVTESSLRRNLKLKDEEGISPLPDTKLFENLTLMGYNISPNQKFSFQKGQFSHQWKCLIHTIMQCISAKSTGFNEFSSNIATALVCLATNRTYNFSKMIFDGLVKNVSNKISKFLIYPRIVPLFDSMLVQQGKGSCTPTEPQHTPSPEAQSPSHTTHTLPSLPHVTTTSLPTITQSDTPIDRATIDKSSTLPHDSAPRVTSPVADEGSMQQTIPELTALCTSLQRQLSELTAKFQAQEVEINRLKERIKMLEDREGVAATRSGDDSPIKGRSIDEGDAATQRISDDLKEMATVLTSRDATTVLASGVVDVPTGSRSIPTASTPAEEKVPTGSDMIPTASLIFATVVTPYRKRKGKEVMVESETPKKQKVQEQIDAQEYHQFASELPIERRIELITDLVKYQDNYAKIYKYQSQQRKPMSKKQNREYYMAVIRNNLGCKVKDFRGMTFEEVEAKFNSVWKQMEDFILMGSKEESERIKRKGLSLEQESTKKQKTSEEVPKEAMSPEEVPEEKVKEMMHLVPIEEVYVEALQVKHPIIDWKVYTEGQRSYWKITRLGGHSASYHFFIDLLKHLDREDLNQLWRLVKETLSNRPPISEKEMELWVEPSRLYEPDNEDQLWTHTQNFMHALVEWKLYDTYGVHHVTSKDKEIFMLVEKDYPLRKGLALVMISYKLQVENYLQMVNDLILKIYNCKLSKIARIATCTHRRVCRSNYGPPILADQFEMKHSLINMMTTDQFFGLEKDNPHDHIWASRRWLEKEPARSIHTWEDLVFKFINELFSPSRTTNLRNEISNFQQRFYESFHEAWDRYKDLLRACPHHGFTKLHQLDTFYNALNPADQDSLNAAAGEIAKFTHAVNQQTSAVTTAMTAIFKQFQATQPPASVKAVEEICVTCGGAHPYYQCLAAGGNTFPELQDNIQGYVSAAAVNYNQGNSIYRPPGSGSLPSNTVANPKGKHKSITTRSGIILDGPTVPTPPTIINPKEDERVEETLTDPDVDEYTIKVPPPPKMLKALMSNKEKLQELANTTLNKNCSAVILKRLPEKLEEPGKFLIPYGFSELKCKSLADLGASINLMPLSVWKKLGLPELISTRMTLELANRAICTPAGIASDVFVTVGKFTFPADFVIVDYESDPRVPFILGRLFLRTARALIDVHEVQNDIFDLEGGNVLPEKLLDLDCTKDLYPPLHVNPVSGSTTYSSSNPLLEEFTDEHALDYSSPPIFDEYDDDFLEIKSDTKNVYDDHFDSMGKKIKESKLLIDELDLPYDFLLSEYDSFISQDFSRVDAKPSTNNEDKVFKPGFLIQENHFEIITRFVQDKKLATSNASLILEDFDPPFYEPFSSKKFTGLRCYSHFHLKMRKKFSNHGFTLLKKCILLLSQNYLIRAIKFSKSTKFSNA
nr:DNA-directed DNA polymerase [Tanacetum cinerariifolium]